MCVRVSAHADTHTHKLSKACYFQLKLFVISSCLGAILVFFHSEGMTHGEKALCRPPLSERKHSQRESDKLHPTNAIQLIYGKLRPYLHKYFPPNSMPSLNILAQGKR